MKEIIRVESISQVHDYFQLGKPKHPLVSIIRYDNSWANVPVTEHRFVLELYQVSLKSFLAGSFTYGRNSYDFQEGTLVMTGPGQVMEFDENHVLSELVEEGWSLMFHPDLIRKSPLGQNIDDYSFFSYEANEALHLSDDEKHSINQIIDKIEKEIHQNIDRHSQKLIVSNIELLLDYCTRFYDRQFYTRTNLNKDILNRFDQLLKSYYSDELQFQLGVPSVSYCGQSLNMSSKYLSDLLKKETGINAKAHIDDFLINKAKNKLLSTTDSVSEIAFSLGFDYAQHFSRIFKAKTGMSPLQYRGQN